MIIKTIKNLGIGGIFIKKGKLVTGVDLKEAGLCQEVKFGEKHKDPFDMFETKLSKRTKKL